MKTAELPPQWDDVGFPEFRSIVEAACDADTAETYLQSLVAAEAAWEGNSASLKRNIRVSDPSLKKLNGQLKKYASVKSAALVEALGGVNAAYVLGAIAALGAVPESGMGEPFSVPGHYDREIEWLWSLPLSTDGRIPSWDVVVKALWTARECLLAESSIPSPNASPLDQMRGQFSSESSLSTTYGPIAFELTNRLTKILIAQSPMIGRSYLSGFASETQSAFQEHATRITDVLNQTFSGQFPNFERNERLGNLIREWTVSSLVDALSLSDRAASTSCVRDLTTEISARKRSSSELRDKPFLTIGNSTVLVLARRVLCDRHELLDRSVSRLIKQTGTQAGTYPDLRASMLDTAIAESMAILLPGSAQYVGESWTIDGKEAERDIVVIYEDIAIYVETKAPQTVATDPSRGNSVVATLRNHISQGVNQVTSIADALEAGTAYLDGQAVPPVRRAYRLVASFNSWWGISLDAGALLNERVFPSIDAAMLTSVDMFLCYETLIPNPADFIAFLDHRLSHQRRPWVHLSDEFEMIGGYFTNGEDNWRHPPTKDTTYVFKPMFQDDIDATIRAAYSGSKYRSVWLERQHTPLIGEHLKRWEQSDQADWLLAFSAASRLPFELQRRMAGALPKRSLPTDPAIRKVSLGTATVIVLQDTIDRKDWDLLLRRAQLRQPLIVVERTTNRIRAIRGIDDHETWVDADWRAALPNSAPPAGAQSGKAIQQRTQPKRVPRRKRRPSA